MAEPTPERPTIEPGEVEPGEVEPGEVELGEVESGEVESALLAFEAASLETDAAAAGGDEWAQEEWLADIDPATSGLEIGPLYTPRFPRSRYQVRYVDHASTEDLREKYASDAFMAQHLDEIVDVDFVWSGSAPLLDVVGGAAPFDWVFASHVIEHAPDMIGWLRQVGSVLADGGRLCLAIPDKRLCFDVNRDLTTMADLVDAHLRGLSAPGFRQIYDFHSRIIEVDAAALWAGTADYRGTWRTDLDPDEWAYELCLKAQQTGEYVDGHCQVFTPTSFVDVYARLVALGLIDYRIAAFHPSVWGTIEFRVVFEKLPPSMSTDERRAAQLASIPTFDDPVPPGPAGSSGSSGSVGPVGSVGSARSEAGDLGTDDVEVMAVSTRERSLILSKRRAIEKARALAGRVRRRGSS